MGTACPLGGHDVLVAGGYETGIRGGGVGGGGAVAVENRLHVLYHVGTGST